MSENPNARDPLAAFTKPGRLLVICSTLSGAGVCYYCLANDLFAPGLHPIFIFLLPGIMGAVTLFTIGCCIYRLLGIRVWKSSNTGRSAADMEESRPNDGEPKPPTSDQSS